MTEMAPYLPTHLPYLPTLQTPSLCPTLSSLYCVAAVSSSVLLGKGMHQAGAGPTHPGPTHAGGVGTALLSSHARAASGVWQGMNPVPVLCSKLLVGVIG